MDPAKQLLALGLNQAVNGLVCSSSAAGIVTDLPVCGPEDVANYANDQIAVNQGNGILQEQAKKSIENLFSEPSIHWQHVPLKALEPGFLKHKSCEEIIKDTKTGAISLRFCNYGTRNCLVKEDSRWTIGHMDRIHGVEFTVIEETDLGTQFLDFCKKFMKFPDDLTNENSANHQILKSVFEDVDIWKIDSETSICQGVFKTIKNGNSEVLNNAESRFPILLSQDKEWAATYDPLENWVNVYLVVFMKKINKKILYCFHTSDEEILKIFCGEQLTPQNQATNHIETQTGTELDLQNQTPTHIETQTETELDLQNQTTTHIETQTDTETELTGNPTRIQVSSQPDRLQRTILSVFHKPQNQISAPDPTEEFSVSGVDNVLKKNHSKTVSFQGRLTLATIAIFTVGCISLHLYSRKQSVTNRSHQRARGLKK